MKEEKVSPRWDNVILIFLAAILLLQPAAAIANMTSAFVYTVAVYVLAAYLINRTIYLPLLRGLWKNMTDELKLASPFKRGISNILYEMELLASKLQIPQGDSVETLEMLRRIDYVHQSIKDTIEVGRHIVSAPIIYDEPSVYMVKEESV